MEISTQQNKGNPLDPAQMYSVHHIDALKVEINDDQQQDPNTSKQSNLNQS
jgi:hypothetical protein